ncbi:cadherin-like domain-containing protein [Rhizobium herbae]
MEEKLILGLPDDGQASVAPANKFRTAEEDGRNRKFVFLPALLFGALGALFSKSEADAADRPSPERDPLPTDPTPTGLERIEDVVAFLREMSQDSSSPFSMGSAPRLASVRVSFDSGDQLPFSAARREGTAPAFNSNDNEGRINVRGDEFTFQPPKPVSSRTSPARHDGGSGPTADKTRANNLPITVGRNVLAHGTMNISTLIVIDDLLAKVHDPDGDKLSITNLVASSGSIQSYGAGVWLYTPERGAVGQVTFTYQVTDGKGSISTQTVLDLLKPLPREIGGTSGDDQLLGTPGQDRIQGRDGDDLIYGGEENDTIFGDAGDDRLFGGDGDDVLSGEGGNDQIFAGRGNDTVYGGSGNDTLYGEEGNDKLVGGTGSDHLFGGSGNDTLFGDEGDDILLGEGGFDGLEGGAGNDTLAGGGGNDSLLGGTGDDIVQMGLVGEEARASDRPSSDGNDTYSGGAGIDTLDAAPARAAVTIDLAAGRATGAGTGSDQVAGFENVTGTAHNDTVTGDSHANVIEGGAGNDRLTSGDGDDTVSGGDGNDIVVMGSGTTPASTDDGNDVYSGGAGTDTLNAAPVRAAVTINLAAGTATGAATGSDQVAGFENVTGTAYNDSVTGNGNANVIEGGAGNDRLTGGDGDDTVSGGAGDDTVLMANGTTPGSADDGDDVYSGGSGIDTLDATPALAAVVINLETGTANGADIGSDQIEGFENVTGTADNDTVIGDDNANVIEGGAGDDQLTGGDGDDTVSCGDGDDTVVMVVDAGPSTDDGDDVYSGGNGIDTIDLAALFDAVLADLEEGYAEGSEIGRDTIEGFEHVIGGRGNDHLSGHSGSDILYGGEGDDQLIGRAGDDLLAGGDGDDRIDGGSGNDGFVVLVATAPNENDGNDVCQGGAGLDTYDASTTILGVVIDLDQGIASGQEIGNDTLIQIEAATGGAGNDIIVDGAAVNIMTGGAGNDVFVFGTASIEGDGQDEIVDFQVGDRIDFSSITTGMGGLVFAGFGDEETAPQTGHITFYHQAFGDGEQTVVRAIIDFEHDDDIEILLQGHHNLTEQDFVMAALDIATYQMDRA